MANYSGPPVSAENIAAKFGEMARLVAVYSEKKREADAANHLAMDALNFLNAAQAELDAMIIQFKTNAPVMSDWKREQR